MIRECIIKATDAHRLACKRNFLVQIFNSIYSAASEGKFDLEIDLAQINDDIRQELTRLDYKITDKVESNTTLIQW